MNKIITIGREFGSGNKWGDRRNYDLCINTTNMEIKTIVQMIAKMFE